MRILVTFAVEAEFAPWRKRHDFALVRANSLELLNATLSSADVYVLLTGIGDASASVLGIQMSSFAIGQGFDACISSGLAGGLKSEYAAGDILAARRVGSYVVHADPGTDSMNCDPALVSLAESCGARVVGKFHTADHIVITSQEKTALSDLADAVDMESFDVIKEARAWGAQAIAIRAISDTSEDDLPVDFNLALTGAGDISLARIVGQALLHPTSVPSLLRFGRQSKRATEALADFLDIYLPAVAQHFSDSAMQRRAVQA